MRKCLPMGLECFSSQYRVWEALLGFFGGKRICSDGLALRNSLVYFAGFFSRGGIGRQVFGRVFWDAFVRHYFWVLHFC